MINVCYQIIHVGAIVLLSAAIFIGVNYLYNKYFSSDLNKLYNMNLAYRLACHGMFLGFISHMIKFHWFVSCFN